MRKLHKISRNAATKSATTRNKARDETPSESTQAMTTAMMNTLCPYCNGKFFHDKKTDASGVLGFSRGVMKTAHLVAVAVLHLYAIFTYMATWRDSYLRTSC
jgi:hypothetical protein